MIRTSLFVFTLLMASISLAANEYFHKPNAGEQSLDVVYRNGATGTRTINSVETKYSGYLIDFNYLYSVDADMAFGLAVSTGDVKVVTPALESKNKGFSDLTAKYMGSADYLQYGADLLIGTIKARAFSTADDGNRNVGGFVLTPYLGVALNESDMNYGGKIDYAYYFDRRIDAANDPTLKGGSVMGLSVFGEFNYGSGFMGATYKIQNASDYKREVGSNSYTYKGDAPNIFKFYFTFEMGSFVLLADYQMDLWKSVDDSNVFGGSARDSYTANTLSLGMRANF